MLQFLLENKDYDCVATRRKTRKGEPPIRSFFAKMFYRIINKMSGTEIVDGARDFRFMTRKFVDAVLSLSEYNRFSKGIFSWVGFKTHWISYENNEQPEKQNGIFGHCLNIPLKESPDSLQSRLHFLLS